jgi:hypothetical protein
VFTVDTGLPTFAGQQHHYVATWAATGGAGGSGRAQWYRDGTLAGGVDVAAATLANVDDSVLWLGRSQYPDNTANADFAEFRMYNRVLTPTEINFSRVNGPDRLVVPLPNAMDDAITLNPGAMALIDVVQNDQGTLLNPNSITITTSPLAGTAQTKPGGKILYTHNGGPALSDQFGYTIKDGLGRTSDVATVHVTISPALRLPNTTITIPNTPPPISYQAVDAFPGLIFTNALALRSPPGNSNQLFVVERRGFISYVPDVTAANPVRQVFLNISGRVAFDNTPEGELGLLSMDFHPGFATNGIFFVYYTAPGGSPYFDRLSRFNSSGLVADSNSEQILFNVVDEEFSISGRTVTCTSRWGTKAPSTTFTRTRSASTRISFPASCASTSTNALATSNRPRIARSPLTPSVMHSTAFRRTIPSSARRTFSGSRSTPTRCAQNFTRSAFGIPGAFRLTRKTANCGRVTSARTCSKKWM